MKNNPVVPGRRTGKLTSSSLFLTQQGQIFHWCKLVPLCLTLPELCLISTICESETMNQCTQEENDGKKLQWLPRRRERKQTLKVTLDKKNGLRHSGRRGGRFIAMNFSALSYIRKYGLGVCGQWTFLFFHPPASFNTELSCTECLLSWFYQIALDSCTSTNRRYQRLWVKVRLCVLWDRNCLFVPYSYLTPNPLVFCL